MKSYRGSTRMNADQEIAKIAEIAKKCQKMDKQTSPDQRKTSEEIPQISVISENQR
jgi:hypothetical protein